MKTGLIFSILLMLCINRVTAQSCLSNSYIQEQLKNNTGLAEKTREIELFTQQHSISTSRTEATVIKIPVVVHILYHYPGEKISDELVQSQIDMLNKCFRHRNADSVKTPAAFKQFAADCEIEFQLAISDPKSRATTGIIRKYTPITKWKMDDAMKFSSNMGDDAWDAKSYLNIWVCHMDKLAGYASFPGGELSRDGIVLDFNAFGVTNNSSYGMGKTDCA